MAKSYAEYAAEQRKKKRQETTTATPVKNNTSKATASASAKQGQTGSSEYREAQKKSPFASNYGYALNHKKSETGSRAFSAGAYGVASEEEKNAPRKGMSYSQWAASQRANNGYNVGTPVTLEGLARQVVDDSNKRRAVKAKSDFQKNAASALGLNGRPLSDTGIQKAVDRANYEYKRQSWNRPGVASNKTANFAMNQAQTRRDARDTARTMSEERREKQARQESLRRQSGREGNIIPQKRQEENPAPVREEPYRDPNIITFQTRNNTINERKDSPMLGYTPRDYQQEVDLRRIRDDAQDYALYRQKGAESIFDPDEQAMIDRTIKGISPVDYMTNEEKQNYDYLVGKYGINAAKAYEQRILPEANRRMTEAFVKEQYDTAKANPLKGIKNDLVDAFWSGEGALQAGVNLLNGDQTDYNSLSFLGSRGQSASHSGVIDAAKENFGDNIVTNILAEGGLSVLENAARYPFGSAGIAVMGMEAATGSMIEAKERGASDEQAFAYGVTAGIVEYLTEEVSLGNLQGIAKFTENPIRAFKDLALALATNAGVEASEEMASEILDYAADYFVMGENSKHLQRLREYMSQGMSENEAKLAVFADLMKDTAMSGAVGAVSGVGMSGPVAAFNYGMNASYENQLDQARRAPGLLSGDTMEESTHDLLTRLAEEQDKPTLSDINKWAADNSGDVLTDTATATEETPAETVAEETTENTPADVTADDQLRTMAEEQADLKESQRQALVEAGRNQDENFREVMDSATMLTEQEKVEALSEGNQQARDEAVEAIRSEAAESQEQNAETMTAETNYDEEGNYVGGEEEQRNGLLSEGSGRTLSQSSGEGYGSLSSEAGVSEDTSRRLSENAADRASNRLRFAEGIEANKVLRTARKGQKVYLIKSGTTPALSKTVAMLKANGVKNVTLYASEKALTVDTGEEVRASYDPVNDEITIRANDEYALSNQLGKHELVERGLERGSLKLEECTTYLSHALSESGYNGDKIVKGLGNLYAALSGINLADTSLTDADRADIITEATKEMICDSSGINQFTSLEGYEEEAELMDTVISVMEPYINEKLGYAFDAVSTEESSEVAAEDVKVDAQDEDEDVETGEQEEKPADDTAADLKKAGITISDDGNVAHMDYSTRFAWKTKEEIDKAVAALQKSLGVSEENARAFVESEQSLTNLILSPGNVAEMDYEPDERYEAIKKNSDYPQGTVDFNNDCRKRNPFTKLFNRLQKRNPNRVFTAEDLEIIRQNMIKHNILVACALCYVEERRQKLGEIADGFINLYKNNALLERFAGKREYNKFVEALEKVGDDDYVPNIYDLITYDGLKTLQEAHPAIAEAFKIFNNARGMAAGRLVEGRAEYKRELLTYSPQKVKAINDNGGLRIFSYSDFEAVNLLDIVQIIQDAAIMGIKIQAYTKVPAFAKVVRNTGIKLNRSLIAAGTGVKFDSEGRMVLDLDPVEGIDINDPDFFDSTDDRDVGNILVGMSDQQIRLAMVSDFVDYIIPFHTKLPKSILEAKGIAHWTNYKDSQTDKLKKTGTLAPKQVNIYTDVLQAAEAEGKPIKNKKQFVEKYLEVCKERELIPRFSQFLNVNADGEYVYTEGYHKFLIDFKLFDKDGNIVEQEVVRPVFDDAYNTKLMKDYAAGVGYTDISEDVYRDTVDALNKQSAGSKVHYSSRLRVRQDIETAADDENNPKVIQQGSSKDIRYSTNLFSKNISEELKANMATFFSGSGTVDFALRSIVHHEFAVEYDAKIAAVYKANNGDNIYVDDVRNVDIDKHKGRVEYFHASPVCKNYSNAKNDGGEQELDIETAKATAEAIDTLQPKVVTVENVARYKNSKAIKLIEDALRRNGYEFDKGVYRASDFGGATIRERMFLRAVKDGVLPKIDTSQYKPVSWWNAVADLIPELPKSELPEYMQKRMKLTGLDLKKLKRPIFLLGGEKSGKLTYATQDNPAPTILAHSTEARILMPGGHVLRATPRVMARIQGLPDAFDLKDEKGGMTNAYKVVGNGVPVQLTQGIVGPLLEQNLIEPKSKKTGIKYSSKLNLVSKEQDNEYMDAVKVGNLDKVRKMVAKLAEAAGFANAIPEQTLAYAVRTKRPPKRTIKVYKVFTVAPDGSPTALFVSGTEKLPQGVWLDAQDTWHFTAKNGKMYVPSTQNPYTKGNKTGGSVEIPNEEVRQELIKRGFLPEGSKAKSITALAYRPGWHAGDLPFFPQGGAQDKIYAAEMKKAKQAGEKFEGSDEHPYLNYHRYNQVVFECEMAYDIDYTRSHIGNEKGKASYGKVIFEDMQEMPVDGGYKFATNPMANANDIGSWYISGSLKIGRALTQEECDKILRENGRRAQLWEQGDLDLESLGYKGEQQDAARKTLAPVTYDDDGNVIPLSERFDPAKADIRYSRRLSETGQEEDEKANLTPFGRELSMYLKGRDVGMEKLNTKLQKLKDRKEKRAAVERLMRKARRLKAMSKKGTPVFRSQVEDLIGDLDLVSPGIRKSKRKALTELQAQVTAQAALDEFYAKYHATKYNDLFKRLTSEHASYMDLNDIIDLTEAITALEHSKQTYDKEIRDRDAQTFAEQRRRGVPQQERIKSLKDISAIRAFFKKYNLNMLNPVRAGRYLDGYQHDGVFTRHMEEINDGQTKAADFRMKADKLFEKLNNNWNFVKDLGKQDIEIDTLEGKVKISKGMRIALYLSLGDLTDLEHPSDNIRHIALGGLTIPDEKLYRKGKIKDAYKAGKRVHFAEWSNTADEDTARAIKKIVDGMTPEEMEYAKTCEVFFDQMCKKAINETSLALDGYEKALVDHYFPIVSDSNFLQSNGGEDLVTDATLEGASFLKERTGGRNPVLLEDASRVVLRQRDAVSKYYGLAIPIRNFNGFYNSTSTAYHTSMKEALGKTWLSYGEQYINDMLTDLQFGRRTEGSKLDVFKSAYAGSVLTMNLGTAIKQSSSYPFAASVIGWGPIAKAAGKVISKADYDYMDSITPWGYMRRVGLSGTEMGEVAKVRSAMDNNKAWQRVRQTFDLIRRVDVKTTDTLFFACEEYVTNKYPKLKVRGEEYNRKLAEVYNEVLQRTQPSYDVMQRNAFLRSKSDLTRIAGMFKTQTFNMGGEIIEAASRWRAVAEYAKNDSSYKDDISQARKAFARTVAATVVSQMMLAVLTAAANMVLHKVKDYRDEEGKVTSDAILSKILNDFAQSFAGMTFLGSEAQDIIMSHVGDKPWYDIDYPGLDMINDVISASVKLSQETKKALAGGGSKEDVAKQLGKTAMEAFKLRGIPAQNLYNIVNSVYLYGQEFVDDELDRFDAGEGLLGLTNSSVTKDQYAMRAAAAYKAGDTASGDKWAAKTSEKKLNAAMYGDLGVETNSSKAMVEFIKEGGSAEDYQRGKDLSKEMTENGDEIDERYSYVVNSQDYTPEEKVAWLRSQTSIMKSKGYNAWKGAGGTDWDFLKHMSYLRNVGGDDKQKKVITYIKKQTTNEEKRKALWKMAGYDDDKYAKNMK